MDLQRELRQKTDAFLMANKEQEFSMEQIAGAIGTDDVYGLRKALTSIVRCPFTKMPVARYLSEGED